MKTLLWLLLPFAPTAFAWVPIPVDQKFEIVASQLYPEYCMVVYPRSELTAEALWTPEKGPPPSIDKSGCIKLVRDAIGIDEKTVLTVALMGPKVRPEEPDFFPRDIWFYAVTAHVNKEYRFRIYVLLDGTIVETKITRDGVESPLLYKEYLNLNYKK